MTNYSSCESNLASLTLGASQDRESDLCRHDKWTRIALIGEWGIHVCVGYIASPGEILTISSSVASGFTDYVPPCTGSVVEV